MIVRALDDNGDWTFGKGRNNYLSLNKAVVQNINTRLKSFLGDCFFDAGAGIDWFTRLGGKDELALNLDISTVILNTADVLALLELTVSTDSARVFRAQYQVLTVYSKSQGSFNFDFSTVSL